MARTPIPPGPTPGATTGSRPGPGVSADGRHIGSKLNMVTAELKKLNGRLGIERTNRHLSNIDSNIKSLLDYFTQNQRAAALAARAAQRGGQQTQTNTSTGTQTNQNNQINQNQNTQSTGGLFSRVGDYIKRGGLAALAPLFAVPVIGGMVKRLFSNKAAMKTIGFILADDIVNFILGEKGESELRDAVEDVFNPSAAIGFGFLGSLINKKMRNIGFIVGAFATEENVDKFDKLMTTINEETIPKVREKLDGFTDKINDFFGVVAIPRVEDAVQNLSDNVGEAIDTVDDILKGDYKAYFSKGGATLTFGAALALKIKGFSKVLRKAGGVKGKMASAAFDALLYAMGYQAITAKADDTGLREGEDEGGGGVMDTLMSPDVLVPAGILAVQGGIKAAAAGYAKMAANVRAGPGGAAAFNAARQGLTYKAAVSRSQKLMNILKRAGYQFDKAGRMLMPGGPGGNRMVIASHAYINAALKKVGYKNLGMIILKVAAFFGVSVGVAFIAPAAAAAVGTGMVLFNIATGVSLALALLPEEIQRSLKDFVGSAFASLFSGSFLTPADVTINEKTGMTMIGDMSVDQIAGDYTSNLTSDNLNRGESLLNTLSSSTIQTLPNAQKRMLLEQMANTSERNRILATISDSSIKNSNNSTSTVQNTYYGGVGSSADNNGIMGAIFGNGAPLSYAHGGIALR
jgi:hypothetical protein